MNKNTEKTDEDKQKNAVAPLLLFQENYEIINKKDYFIPRITIYNNQFYIKYFENNS